VAELLGCCGAGSVVGVGALSGRPGPTSGAVPRWNAVAAAPQQLGHALL